MCLRSAQGNESPAKLWPAVSREMLFSSIDIVLRFRICLCARTLRTKNQCATYSPSVNYYRRVGKERFRRDACETHVLQISRRNSYTCKPRTSHEGNA
eukprot:9480554-Pyramimonas_sp.AAC.1